MIPIASDLCLELLTIMSWPGIGVAKTRALIKGLKPGQTVTDAAQHLLLSNGQKITETKCDLPKKVVEILGSCKSNSISVVCMLDSSYPSLLSTIGDAPPVLYVRGSIPVLSRRSIAVVGTRHASNAGKRCAHVIAEYIASREFSVVSGLALGIDTAAHGGALAAEGATVAVLAHGLDIIAPKTNSDLAHKIIDSGGALVSEHPPGTPPRPPEFARRNRIQSGLSDASIIVESGGSGGAIIQAQFTHAQKRLLCAVISNDPDHNREGADRIIREYDAIPIRTLKDLSHALSSDHDSDISVSKTEQAQLEFDQ